MNRLLIACVVVLLSVAAQAQAQTSPSFEIAPPRVGPSYGDRDTLRTVASRDRFLAVWAERRSYSRNDDYSVRGMRVSSSGEPLDRVSIRVVTEEGAYTYPPIAPLATGSDGTDFLVISGSGSVTRSTAVTADGKLLENSAPLPLATSATLVWLGSEYALIYVPKDPHSTIRYVLLDRSGAQVSAPRDLITTARYVYGVGAATGDGSTIVVGWDDGADGRVHVVQAAVDDIRRGNLAPMVATYGLPNSGFIPFDVTISSDGRGYLCVWNESGSVHARSLTAAGLPLGDAMNLGAIQGAHPSVAFDGSSFLVAFRTPEGKLVTVRIRDGLAEPGVTQPTGDESISAGLASNGSASLLFWIALRTRQTMAAPLPLTTIGPSDPGRVISLGSAFRSSINAVWRGDHYLATWMEYGNGLVYGRFDIAGNPLDGAGVTLGPADYKPALATDGDTALVAWPSGAGMTAVSIDHAGRATTPAILSPNGAYETPVITWNGREYVAVWKENVGGNRLPHTVGVRVGRDGKLIGGPHEVTPDFLNGLSALMPVNDGYYALIQTRVGGCVVCVVPPVDLWVGFLSPDLTLLGPPEQLSSSQSGSPFIVKRGADSLLVWAHGLSYGSPLVGPSRIRGARISGAGLVIDRPEGFEIGEGAHVTGVMATPAGFTVVAGATSWDVSVDAYTISRTTAFAFVPPDLSTDVWDFPSPFSLLVAGGPRPLIIYQHAADEQHDFPYFVGTFAPAGRTRSVRH